MPSRINDGDLTMISIDKNILMDYENEDVFQMGIDYIDELSESNFFFDRLKVYLHENKSYLGFNDNEEDKETVFDFVKSCFEASGIKGDKKSEPFSYNPSVIKKWIDGSLPSPKSRVEIFRFCLCLKMNTVHANEFILKGCLTKPFNFKSISESVYYFCMNNKKSYADVLRIINEIENTSISENPFPENDTLAIRDFMCDITDEKKLINYLAYNRAGFEKQNQTAISLLKELVERSVIFAEWERTVFEHDNSNIAKIESKKDIASILNIILGYEARANDHGKEVYKKKIADSNFPKLIKENFPQPQQIQTLLKSGSGSSELVRKALILFTFYNMFAELKQQGIENSDSKFYNEFADEIDSMLAQCGYIQMYWRHPYDWMFGFCAASIDPLITLREIISICYTDIDEFYI